MKSWYRPIDMGLWADERFRRLSAPNPCGRYLLLYLMTGEHTDGMPGLWVLGVGALAEVLGWSVTGLRRAMAELEREGLACVDHEKRVVYVPYAIECMVGINPKQLKGLGKLFAKVPACALKDAWRDQMADWARSQGPNYIATFDQAFGTVPERVSDRVSGRQSSSKTKPRPLPNPLPHSNLKTKEHHGIARSGSATHRPQGEGIPIREIVDYLNDKSGRWYDSEAPEIRQCILDRWHEGHRLPAFKAVVDMKCDSRRGNPMERDLRPETLFGTEFNDTLATATPADPSAGGPHS